MMSIIYIWISVLIIIENKSPIVNVYCEVTSFICSHCGPFTIRKDRPLLHKYVAIALQRNWLQCIISQMQTLLAVGDRLPEQRDEFRLQKKFRIQNSEKFREIHTSAARPHQQQCRKAGQLRRHAPPERLSFYVLSPCFNVQ